MVIGNHLGRLRWINLCEFKVNMVYIVRLCLNALPAKEIKTNKQTENNIFEY